VQAGDCGENASDDESVRQGPRNVAAAAGIGFMFEIGKLYEPKVGWDHEGDDFPCPSALTARPTRSRQRLRSKSGGAERLRSKDQTASRLNRSANRSPFRKGVNGDIMAAGFSPI
jgi:hypothetical protein